jgi:hypothetical protein
MLIERAAGATVQPMFRGASLGVSIAAIAKLGFEVGEHRRLQEWYVGDIYIIFSGEDGVGWAAD